MMDDGLSIFLLGFARFTRVHLPTGGGGQPASSSVSESVRGGGWLSSCALGSSGLNGFLVVGIPDTSSCPSRALGPLGVEDLVSVTLTPHNVMTFAWVVFAAG